MSNTAETYIESRLPLEAISIESQRERGASSALPPLYFLHVWWARRPLTASRAAILGTLLPSSVSDHDFLGFLGIKGDPVSAGRKIREAKRNGIRIKDPFGYKRAFTYNPTQSDLTQLEGIYDQQFGTERPLLLDPMAGGGSIPLEAIRIGTRVVAGESNPVAYVILKATIDYPVKFGRGLTAEIAKWGKWVNQRARKDLAGLYPCAADEQVLAYIWARTVRCPSCSLLVPLSPNWWLSNEKGKKERIAVRPKVPRSHEGNEVEFEIVNSIDSSFRPAKGTGNAGKSSCPRTGCNNTIPEDYIKSEAQNGRMGNQLYAVFIKKQTGPDKWEKTFRSPNANDLQAFEQAIHLAEDRKFLGSELVPEGSVPEGLKTREPLNYGMRTWDRFFNERQLVAHSTYLYHIIEAKKRILEEYGHSEKATALITYLNIIFDKGLNYNSLLSLWHPYHTTIANTFDRHDFAFVWSYGEMNMTVDDLGFEWSIRQVVDAYDGLCIMLGDKPVGPKVCLGSCTELSYIKEPLDVVVIDPPYYANVMYAELSDFFYVWMKRVIGDLHPGFATPLTDKDNEAVANPARFRGLGGSAEGKAKEDYRRKMALSFKRIHAALKPNGILVVMFTHKTTEAWDTLASALIEAGFQIRRSWPVRTESEHSLHIAKKNAVKSTILLVARKMRDGDRCRGWWEQDVFPEIEKVAAEKAADFEQRGIEGVDLYISTFGPVLEVFSRYSEVKSMTGKTVRPEEALDVARKVVTERTFRSLVAEGGVGIDPETRFYILAMRFYGAREIPYDEAHKLAISVGIEAEELREDTFTRKREESKPRMLRTAKPKVRRNMVKRKGEFVKILDASEREHAGHIDLANPSSKPLLDAIHLAELAFHRGGLKAYQRLAGQIGLDTNPDFQTAMKALEKALPDADPEKRALASILVSPIELRSKGSRIDEYSEKT